MKRLITILTVITLAVGLITCLWSYDQSKANASDLLVIRAQIANIQKSFEAAEKRRRAENVEERIWLLEQRFVGKEIPLSTREEIRRLEKELKELRGDK